MPLLGLKCSYAGKWLGNLLPARQLVGVHAGPGPGKECSHAGSFQAAR